MTPASSVSMSEVGRRITLIREALGWTPAHLARKAHVHRTELFHLERGQKPRVTAAVMWRVARALGVTFEELWTGQKPAASPPSIEALTRAVAQTNTELARLLSTSSSATSPGSISSPEDKDRGGRTRGGSSRRSS